MKKLFITFIYLISLDVTANHKFDLYGNVLGLFVGVANVGVESNLNELLHDKLSLGLEYTLIDYGQNFVEEEGHGIGALLHYYLNGVFKEGWTGTLRIGGFSTEATLTALGVSGPTTQTKLEASGIYYGASFGHLWKWDHWGMKIQLGVSQYQVNSIKIATGVQSFKTNMDGVIPFYDVSVNYSF